MNHPQEIQLVICNCPDDSSAEALARGVIEARLAACVNLLPPVRSIYRWQEQVEMATEIPLLIKTTAQGYPRLQQWLVARHPYTVPEIIAVPVSQGLPAYLDWVGANVMKDSEV